MNLLCRRRTKSKEDDTPIGIALVSFLVSFLVFYESESKCDILIVTRQLQASYHLSDTSRIYTLRLGQVFLSQSIFPIKLSKTPNYNKVSETKQQNANQNLAAQDKLSSLLRSLDI